MTVHLKPFPRGRPKSKVSDPATQYIEHHIDNGVDKCFSFHIVHGVRNLTDEQLQESAEQEKHITNPKCFLALMKRGGTNHQPPDFMALFYLESLHVFIFPLDYASFTTVLPRSLPFRMFDNASGSCSSVISCAIDSSNLSGFKSVAMRSQICFRNSIGQ